jgi:hypothetical protein
MRRLELLIYDFTALTVLEAKELSALLEAKCGLSAKSGGSSQSKRYQALNTYHGQPLRNTTRPSQMRGQPRQHYITGC